MGALIQKANKNKNAFTFFTPPPQFLLLDARSGVQCALLLL